MRQAGRCLPEYRAMKEKYSFLEMVQNPELAAEVTLQPIRRFDFDAAILFSDILVVPEGMGQGYRFREEGGIAMSFALNTKADVERLAPEAVVERLQYVRAGLGLCKKALGQRTALIGFAGAPWTLANFMLEGGSAEEFTKAKRLFYSDRALFDALLEKLTLAVTEYLRMQVEAGVDAIQIFESLGGVLAGSDLEAASTQWIKRIISELKSQVPVIVFCRGSHDNWKVVAETGAQVIGVDWTVPLSQVYAQLPSGLGVQGNLDPLLLTTTPEIVARETGKLLNEMRGCRGHIFNLGHGVPPDATLENLGALVTTVREFV